MQSGVMETIFGQRPSRLANEMVNTVCLSYSVRRRDDVNLCGTNLHKVDHRPSPIIRDAQSYYSP